MLMNGKSFLIPILKDKQKSYVRKKGSATINRGKVRIEEPGIDTFKFEVPN